MGNARKEKETETLDCAVQIIEQKINITELQFNDK